MLVHWDTHPDSVINHTKQADIIAQINDFIDRHDLPDVTQVGIKVYPGVYHDTDGSVGWLYFGLHFYDAHNNEDYLPTGEYVYVVAFEKGIHIIKRSTEYKCSCN